MQARGNGGYDVFISYRSARRDWVETLARNLRRSGRRVFFDQWELVAGSSFPRQLSDGIDAARSAVLVASPDTVESGWVRDEYDRMLLRKHADPTFRFVPIAFGELPDLPFLSSVQCVDFTDTSDAAYRRAFSVLVRALEGQPPGPEPKVLPDVKVPVRATEGAMSHGREKAFLDAIFARLGAPTVPVMLLAQADSGQELLVARIRERARDVWRRFDAFPVPAERSGHRAAALLRAACAAVRDGRDAGALGRRLGRRAAPAPQRR